MGLPELVRRYAGRGSDAHHPGTKVNASRHSALSHGHALKWKEGLHSEVEQLLRLAEAADAAERPAGMDIPQELAHRTRST